MALSLPPSDSSDEPSLASSSRGLRPLEWSAESGESDDSLDPKISDFRRLRSALLAGTPVGLERPDSEGAAAHADRFNRTDPEETPW